MRYSLVVPALNEEEAIAGTLRRLLAAREKVVAATPVSKMTVVFVNDGSTDRTQEIVDQPEFDDVVKVRFPKNRGYGAAIKAGWKATDDELVGFIDGDGTCDPEYSIQLINRLVESDADVVLAGRLNPQSKMPGIRKLGNILFAKLLNVVSRSEITDCASGFRVVKRSSLRLISPLPNGLHFTPAMSAICLLDPRLRIEEVPMPYEDRIGKSKLRVIKDGFRFLYIILFTTCCYSPIRTMLAIAGLWMAFVAALVGFAHWRGIGGAAPSLWLAGGLVAVGCVFTGVICHQLNYLLMGPRRNVTWIERTLQKLTEYKLLIVSGVIVSLAAMLTMSLGASAGSVASRGSLVLVFLAAAGAAVALAGVVLRVIWAVAHKQHAMLYEGPWDVMPSHSALSPSTAHSTPDIRPADPLSLVRPLEPSV